MSYTALTPTEIELMFKPGIENLVNNIFFDVKQEAMMRLESQIDEAMGAIGVKIFKILRAEIIGTEIIIRIDTKDIKLGD